MAQLPDVLKNLSNDKLESLCVNCGLCCAAHISVEKGFTVLVPELRCKHLIAKGNGESCCSVYENRLDVAKGWCVPLAEGIEKGLFPEECPYVREVKDYVGAAVLPDTVYQQLRPLIKKAITSKGKPEWASDSLWNDFVEDK